MIPATKMNSRAALVAAAVAAIVIIGFAAWSVHESIYKKRIAAANADLAAITHNVRGLFSRSPTVDISGTADMALSATDAGHTVYIESGVFPASMMTPGRRAVLMPWGGGAAVAQAAYNARGDAFYVYFDQMPRRACIDLLNAAAAQGHDPLLLAVGAGEAGSVPAVTAKLPVVPTAAQELCAASKNAVGFEYQLHAGDVVPAARVAAPAPRVRAHKAEEHNAEEHRPVEHKDAPKPAAPKPATAKPAKATDQTKKAE